VLRTFRGEAHNKVDAKGRVSIPALFRRVLEANDPDWKEGLNPTIVIVAGGDHRKQLECYTAKAIAKVDKKINKLSRGSKKRIALQRQYHAQAITTTVDETGRLVLPPKYREKIKLGKEAYFVGNGDTFEIWNLDVYNKEVYSGLTADDDFDPDVDPSTYLDGDEGE